MQAGRASQRGGGRRGGGRFRGGGSGNSSQPVSNSDGLGSYFRGRGRGRGGGRRSQRHDSSSHPEIASTDASMLGHGYAPPINVEQGDPQPSSTVALVQAPVASAALIQKAASTRQPQKAWCELCRVDCNSLEVLQLHKNGKKHKKNLKRLEEAKIVKNPMTMPIPTTVPVHTSIAAGAIATATPASVPSMMPLLEVQNQIESQPESNSEGKLQPENIEGGRKGNTSVVSENAFSEVGGSENKVEGEKQNDSNLAEKPEAADAEPVQVSAKKRKFDRLNARRHGRKQNMRGGRGGKRRVRTSERQNGAAELPKEAAPITCDMCNVKCDTQAVFESHLAGKKHHSKLKRLHDEKAVHGPFGLQALYPSDPNAPTIFLPPIHQQASYAPSGPFPPATSTAQHPVTGSEVQP
ncbi:hypothetical protein Sjap_020253 [Stephania japonica]|uniref:U1-type domain-containing protein n=1 Tax=Stephania japonica TaxID=461633 RepID=A0AAP0F9A0_9MAGN